MRLKYPSNRRIWVALVCSNTQVEIFALQKWCA